MVTVGQKVLQSCKLLPNASI